MIKTSMTPDEYLSRYALQGHTLAQLIRQPLTRQGAVHTPREIAQQPFLWRHTAELMKQNAPGLQNFLQQCGLFAESDRPTVILAGAGTSDYVGLSVADLLRTRFRTPTINWATTRITANPGSFFTEGQKYLIIHFARSGNSPESRAVLDMALKQHPDTIRHIVITCNSDGDLARLASEHPEQAYLIVLHEATNDKGLAMTSSFSALVVAAQALAYLHDMSHFESLISRISESAENTLEQWTDHIYQLARPQLKRVFYLGNGDLYGAAAESALKVQELTAGSLIAKHEDTLAFRHGPVSAVDNRTLVCFFLSEDSHAQRYELDVLSQFGGAFRTMGAHTVLLSSQTPPDVDTAAVKLFTYDPAQKYSIPALFQVNLAVIFGQLFGLFASLRRGMNVDDPSTGKALYSRTVQGVRLYEYGDGQDGADGSNGEGTIR